MDNQQEKILVTIFRGLLRKPPVELGRWEDEN